MANLGDSIRLTTVADLQALSELVNEYKKLGLSISGVAGASRIVSEQIKRDALEQANSTKQATFQTQLSTAELNRQSAELRKNNLELKAQAAALNDSKKSSDNLFGSLSSLTGLRSQLIGLFGAMSIGSFAKDIIDAQSQIQAFDLSMKNLLGEKYGTKLTNDLKRFTVETPLNFEQVIKSSNQLVGSFKAAGASSEVIGREIPIILQSLGNSAAALGGEDRLGRLTYAFSQVQATGRLMGTEVRQITETGFPLLAVMSQTTGKKVSELKDDITAGKVSFEDFKKAILSAGLEGGVFAGSMDIMANTVRGRLDKLSETFFFVKGRIGEFFEDSARSGLNFANSLLKTFLGTDEAIARTVGMIEIAIKTWAGYKILMTALTVIEQAKLVLEGRKILAMEAEIALRVKNLLQLKAERIERGLDVLGIDSQIGVINALATAKVREAQANLVVLTEQRALTLARGLDVVAIDAQIATTTAFIARQTLATTAATKFSTLISSALSPTVLITAAIAALVVVYKEVSDAIEKANQLNYDWTKSNDSQIISVTESNVRMKIAAESVMRLKEGTDLHKQALGDLIKTYPQYFGQLDIEKTKNSQIKAIYDQVNRSIEAKIALMAREKIAEETLNRLVSIRRDLIQSGVSSTNLQSYDKTAPIIDFSGSRGQILEYNKLLAQQAQNEKAMTNERIKNFNLEYEALKKTEAAKTITRYEFLVQRENLMVKYHLKETAATITHNASQEAQEKESASKKYKINADTAEQKEIFNEIVRVKALNKTREHEQQILDLQYKYDVSKVNSATGAAIVKQDKLEDLENKHRIKTAELTSKWDAKAAGAAKTFANQSIKLQEDTAKEKEVFEELVYVKGLEKTRQHETAILDIQYFYDLSKIQNSVGSVKKKNEEVSKLEKAYAKDSAELNRKWNKEELDDNLKAEKDRNKAIEVEAKESAERLWKLITDRISDELKAKEKLIEDLAKLDKDNAKESIKLEEDKYKLIDKLRILQAISRAKNSKEIIELENKEKESILKLNKDSIDKQLLSEKSKLYGMELLRKQNTVEYKTQQGVILKLEQDLTEAQIKLAEFTTDKTKDEIEKRQELNKKALDFITGSAITFLNVLDFALGESLNSTTNLVEKAQIQNRQALVGIAKEGISAITSIVESAKKGDYFAIATSAVGLLADGIITLVTANKRLNEAKLEQARKQFEEYSNAVEAGVAKIVSRIDDIREAYGDIKLESGATIGGTLSENLGLDLALAKLFRTQEILRDISENGIKSVNLAELADILRISLEDLDAILLSSNGTEAIIESLKGVNSEINALGTNFSEVVNELINYGQQIQKEYETAVSNENALFEKKKDSIEKIYDNEVKRIKDAYDLQIDGINKRYDYEELRANQNYNAQTLGIVAAGTAQLEALVTNEESLASVRKEFSDKRLEIEKAFPLASKAITADMSQAEITAINDSIKARDEAFAKLQGWYNDELKFIVNSEGQKRKEYSATETIQNGINARLEAAALIFQGQEIQRAKDRGQAIIDAGIERDKAELVALGVKNLAIQAATVTLNENLVALEKKKNQDIADNYKLLTILLEGYSAQIASAIEKSADRGSEAYRKLINDLATINELLRQIRSNSGSEPLNIGINGIAGFEKGTDNTSVSLSGATVDNRGGKLAVLHPEEAVFSKADMTQMTRFLGKRPTRDEVIERFKMGTKLIDSNSFIQKISPYVINKTEGTNIDLQGLRSDLSKLTREVVKRQQPIVNIDKNGIRTYLTNINSQIEIKNQKFSS